MNRASDTSTASDPRASAWKLLAKMQGIVCLICKNPPAFRRRGRFYATGLCRACETEIAEIPSTSA